MAPSLFPPFFTKKPTKTTPIILRIEKSFQTHPKWHILENDICKYNSSFSTCTHARTGLRKVTDASTVLIGHPAKEHGKPQGLAQVSIQPEEVGRQEQEQSSFPKELPAVVCEPHYPSENECIFEKNKSSAKIQSSF